MWAVLMVKDEADVIGPLLDHLETQGVDGVVLADNLSSDGTPDMAARPFVHLIDDPDPAYRQSEKMTRLCQLAHELAATDDLWLLPMDADEVWYDGDGATLAERLAATNAEAVHVPIWNHWCTSKDDLAEADAFRRIRWRSPHAQEPLGKVAVRWSPDLTIWQGNHGAHRGDTPTTPSFVGLAIRHFPYRSAAHFVTKVRNGAAAYRALEAEGVELGDMGAHWRGYGDLLERGGEQAAIDWFHEHFFYDDPIGALVEDPAPL